MSTSRFIATLLAMLIVLAALALEVTRHSQPNPARTRQNTAYADPR